MTETITKGGASLLVINRGPGRCIRKPKGGDREDWYRKQGWDVLPCGCLPAMLATFTAPYRHHRCGLSDGSKGCGAVFTTHPEGGWAQVEECAG